MKLDAHNLIMIMTIIIYSSADESIDLLTTVGSLLTRLEMIIKDLEAYDIEQVKREAAKIDTLNREELDSFVGTFYDIAVNSEEPDLYVGLAQMIFDASNSEAFKDALVMHVINETSKLLNSEMPSNDEDMTIRSSVMKFIGELYKVGWIKHGSLMECIEELTTDDFETEFQFQLFYILIKTVAIKMKESGEAADCLEFLIKWRDSLQSKIKIFKNVKLYLKAAEMLNLLSTT